MNIEYKHTLSLITINHLNKYIIMKTTLFERVESFNGIEVPVSAQFHTYELGKQYVVVTFSDTYHTDFKMYFNPLVDIKDMHLTCKFLSDTRIIIGGNTRLTGFTSDDAMEYANMIVEELHRMLILRKK